MIGVKDFEYGSPGHYDYLKCTQCGLLKISPLFQIAISWLGLIPTLTTLTILTTVHVCSPGGVSDVVFAGADLLISFSCAATDKIDVIV